MGKIDQLIFKALENMKVSLVITVLNEEETITSLLESIFSQTKKPDEVIIVDGGSKDKTIQKIREHKEKLDKKGFIRVIEKKGANRPVGRNLGIEAAKEDIIAITDAGCVLDKRWIEEITDPFNDSDVEVVSGYYKTMASSVFEKCLATYALVMPERINPKEFLPSARSMAIRKSTWRDAGGFPENFPFNEDYVFAHTLKRLGENFYFTKKAIVYWKPRENIQKAFLMFFYFAKGDANAYIFRPKVILIFLRYTIGVLLLFKSLVFSLLIILYFIWAILKNYRYVKEWQAFLFLPLLQIASDVAVIAGTIWGTLKKQ